MEILEAIEALKNNNELCRDGSEGECLYCEDDKCYCAVALVVSALEEYIAIGTVEECREAREKQIPRNLSMTGYMPAPTATQSCCKVLLKQRGNAVRNVGRYWIGAKQFE